MELLIIREILITVAEGEFGGSKNPRLGYALELTRTILVPWIR